MKGVLSLIDNNTFIINIRLEISLGFNKVVVILLLLLILLLPRGPCKLGALLVLGVLIILS